MRRGVLPGSTAITLRSSTSRVMRPFARNLVRVEADLQLRARALQLVEDPLPRRADAARRSTPRPTACCACRSSPASRAAAAAAPPRPRPPASRSADRAPIPPAPASRMTGPAHRAGTYRHYRQRPASAPQRELRHPVSRVTAPSHVRDSRPTRSAEPGRAARCRNRPRRARRCRRAATTSACWRV